jgi:dephospho-CoA kinase
MKTINIGITGGIGSGKTTVCKLFVGFGVPIYNADERAKLLMTTDKEIITNLKKAFGTTVYLPDGALNRAFLANIVFNNAEKLAELNTITHPAVLKDTENWQKLHTKQPYTLKEAALLIESGSYQQLDKLIVVVAPLEVRIARTMHRDNCDRAAVLARIGKQLSDEERAKYADFVITNEADYGGETDNNNRHDLVEQVWRLHRLFSKMETR